MHGHHAGYRNGESASPCNGNNSCPGLRRTIGYVDGIRSKYLLMESVYSIECNHRFNGDSESVFNDNLYSNRRCKRMHIHRPGNGDHKPGTGCNGFSKHYHLHRSEYNTDSKRGQHLYMEPIHIA